VEFFSESEESHQVKSTCKSKNIQKQEEEILAPFHLHREEEEAKKFARSFCFSRTGEGHPLSFCLPKQKKSRALVVNKISLPFPQN
jgi:hypothetical protein